MRSDHQHANVQPTLLVQGAPLEAPVPGGTRNGRAGLRGTPWNPGGGGAVGGQARHCQVLLGIKLPPGLEGATKVAAGDRTYALLRVPFRWHQAPGLGQALIADLPRDIRPQGVVVV